MIYAPLRPLLRLWRIVVYFLANLDHILDTNFDRYAYTEAGRRELEAGIAFGEDGINIMIYARTCELLGVTPIIKSPIFQEPAKSRPIAELLARHARMLDRLRTFEQRAQRRAARILREIEQAGPLGCNTMLQSPALRAEDASAILLDVLPRRRRCRLRALAGRPRCRRRGRSRSQGCGRGWRGNRPRSATAAAAAAGARRSSMPEPRVSWARL